MAFLFKYRYLLALCVFAFCVVFEITGSSVGQWCSYFGYEDAGVVLGRSRGIRSDEWAVSTPMLFSQYENAAVRFPYFGSTLRGTATDMFLEYGQPVYTIGMLFRPFYWGYLFLPLAKGMAFFWCGRWIALFLVSFEFGMLWTKKSKKLSLVTAFLISFAPVVQWWFAINGLVEMLIYIQLSIVMLWKYMNTQSFWKRTGYAAVIAVCAGGYVLTMYPSWQISFFYVLLGLAIWTFWENAKTCRMHKADWFVILAAAAVCGGILGYTFWKSGDTIRTIMDTVYPGDRFETGGGLWKNMFEYTTNIWMAVFERSVSANVCEGAKFVDFFPFCYVLPAVVLVKERKADKALGILLAVSLFLGIYCAVGFPRILAGITFLSNVQAGRAIIAFGFCNVLLLTRALSLLQKPVNAVWAAGLAAAGSLFAYFVVYSMDSGLYGYRYMVVTVLLFAALYYGILRFPSEKAGSFWCAACIGVMVIAGGLVNPVRCGIDDINSIPELQTIREMAQLDPDALWAVEGELVPGNNMGIMVGAPTVNSTNVYPNLALWKRIDPDGTYLPVYNRYAHIRIDLKKTGAAGFFLGKTQDTFSVRLTVNDLRKLGVTYLISRRNLRQYEKDGVRKVTSSGSICIYRIAERGLPVPGHL